MLTFASPLINGAAVWKIVVASLVGGAGVAIAFGLLLLGLQRARSARAGGGGRLLGYSVAALAATFCLAAVVIGIVAMVDKPASKPPQQPPANAKAAVSLPRMRVV
jgi:nitrate reductase gamma subunit